MKKLIKITKITTLPKSALFLNYQRYRSQMLIAQIEDFNGDCNKISGLYLLYFPRNEPSKSVTVEPSRPGRLGPDRVGSAFKAIQLVLLWHTNYFNFFDFLERFQSCLNVSELFRGDPYMTANKNFVRYAHS